MNVNQMIAKFKYSIHCDHAHAFKNKHQTFGLSKLYFEFHKKENNMSSK